MLLSICLVVIFNIFIYKSFFNPIILQSVLWLIYFLILSANIESFNVNLEEVYYFLICQLVGFGFGGFMYWFFFMRGNELINLLPPNEEKYEQSANTIAINNINLLCPLVIVILCCTIYFILKESDSVSLLDVSELRDTLTADDGKRYGTYGFIQLMVSVYLLIYISISARGILSSSKYKLLFILFFSYTYLLGSRGQFIVFLIPVFYLLLWQRRLNFTRLFTSIIFVLLVMFIVTFSRNNNIDSSSLSETFVIYTTSSLPALVIESPSVFEYSGSYTFRVVYLWLNKVGFEFPIDPIISKWTYTPFPTNVYSYLKPYYYDFGIIGVIILPFILGFLYNFLFQNAKKGSQVSLLILSMFIYPMLMQTLEEQYFRWASNWIYIYILIKIITKVKLYGSWCSNSHIQS